MFEPEKNEYRDCRKCWYETREELFICPRCSTELHSESKIRNAGSVDVTFGGLLTVMMTGIFFGLLLLYVLGSNADNAQTRANFAKPEATIVFTFALFFVVGLLGFGATMVRAGRYAVKHGRRDRARIKRALTLLFGGLIIGELLMILVG